MSDLTAGVMLGAGGQDGETPNGGSVTADVAVELERLKAALKAANNESAARRKKLEELEAAEELRKTAELSEVEKAKKAQADAEAKAQATEERFRTATLRSAVVTEAARMSFYDPEDAFRLADLAELQVGDDGKVTGVEAALKTLAKAKPHLVKSASGGGEINSTAAGRQTRPSTDELVQRKRASGTYTPI